MAVYHVSMRMLSRSDRNTVKALAYRAGTDLYDEATGKWFYHSDKEEVRHVEWLLPEEAPAWALALKEEISQNRQRGVQKYCTLMERAEKRKDSQVYREFEFALPEELIDEQNIALAKEFLQDQVCGRDIPVLANFHFDKNEKTGEPRPHCHALLGTRRLEEQGFSSHKETAWNKKELLETLREQWAAYANFHLKLHGHEARIDHRSYEEQGIDILPQPKLARGLQVIEQRPSSSFEQKRLDRRVRFEQERYRNVAKLIKKPETVFEIITRQQSTFMWGDVEKVLARYVREEALFESLNIKLKASPELILLREEKGATSEGGKEDVSVYTTQSMLRAELSLVGLSEKLGGCKTHTTREEEVTSAVSKSGLKLSQDQEDALRHVTQGDQLSCIIGYAGSGKSTLFKVAKEAWEASGYRVYGLAPTGRAAQNLEEIGIPSQTLHKFLKDYKEGRSQYKSKTVLILDEAGMVDVGRFSDLLQAANHLGVKLVASGDGAQAQPIEAGPGFRLVTDRLNVPKLETVIRQQESWQREATRLFGTYQTEEALALYLEKGHVRFVEEKVPDLEKLLSKRRHKEIIDLYLVSRRVAGNMWHSLTEDLKNMDIPLDQASSHTDFSSFKKWHTLRQMCVEHMADHLEIYRPLMKEKGVDPVAFASYFVDQKLSLEERQEKIKHLIKTWQLAFPDPDQPLHRCDIRLETRQALVTAWERSIRDNPQDTHVMVAQTKRDTHLLNEEARALRRLSGDLAIEEFLHTVKKESRDDFGNKVTEVERKGFSKGERIVFTRNHKGMGVKNGTLGTLEEVDRQKLKVRIDGEDRVVSFASNVYPYFDQGWAITVIKSQGSTADRVFKLATFEEDRNLSYVGMTRHRKSLQVFASKLDFWKEEVFITRLSQSREKLSSLDYLSPEEGASRLNPPERLKAALSSIGHRLEAWGYVSRKGWESLCERFLGKVRPEEQIVFPQGTIEEILRAREMGIRQEMSDAVLERDPQDSQKQDQPLSNGADDLRNLDETKQGIPGVIKESSVPLQTLSQEDMISLQDQVATPEAALNSATGEDRKEKPFTKPQLPDVSLSREGQESKTSRPPFYSLEDVAHQITPYAVENLSQPLLGHSSAPQTLPQEAPVLLQVQVPTPEPALNPSALRENRREKPHAQPQAPVASFPMEGQRRESKPRQPFYSVEDVRGQLTPYSVESLCQSLLGQASHSSTKRQLRFGDSGSLAVSLSGKTLGQWKDFSRDEGGDIFKLVQRERGGDFKEALTWVAEALRVGPQLGGEYKQASSSESSELEDLERRQRKVQKLLEASRPLPGTLAERYLREHRNIQGKLPSNVRFISSLWHSGEKRNFPALVSLARDSYGTVTAVQAVYLDEQTGNKADVDLKKQSFGLVKSSYVWLQKGEGPVFVAEGVETALSIKEAGMKGDIYAALGISNFKNVSTSLQDKTRPLIICADQDGEGTPAHKAVEKAVESLKDEGLSVSVLRPSAEHGKEDFNDVLKREGVEGVRAYFEGYLEPSLIPLKQDNIKHESLSQDPKILVQDQGKALDPSSGSASAESSTPTKPSKENVLEVEKAVKIFIQLSDRASDINALVSGESKSLFEDMDKMIETWKEDARFAEKVEASGHRRAAQYIEQYHMEQNRLHEKTRGNVLEI